ncbi:RNA polymerase sigma factor [Bacteroides sp. Marseille-P3684]|uniref:RNA polymerase sigma factor n=1 Tax=Bacteroides sp. Marseille-P3684 TaxID=2086579 RepID=UPI000D0AD2C2|nr:RNA polymerase sigma factor [Bacteroides sp. Marseille-P3684]
MQAINFRNDILPLKDKLFRLALRITMNRAEAEDVVQETMLRVWGRRDEWEGMESVEAYCLTVCRNLAIDRSQLKESQNEELTESNANTPDSADPYSLCVRNEQMALIHRLISGLPEKQRTILQLRDVEGKSYKEIADIVGVSEEQVKVNLFRARQKIKQQYTEINDYGL